MKINREAWPKKGDVWEFRRKGRKVRKTIGNVSLSYLYRMRNGEQVQVRVPYADFERLPKGRYSGRSVRWLLQNGTRISTAAERRAKLDEQIAKRRKQLGKDHDDL